MRRLHIGGQVRVDGWEVLDANAGPTVDHVADARDLGQFSDETFDVIYASHVVEHLDYRDVLLATLREWRRVMIPGGTLYVSVPDLATLASMFVLKDQLNMEERYHVMRMIFGGHVDSHDYHLVGLDQEFLGTFLTQAGFGNLRRVRSFGLFQDTSEMLFKGIPISLNVIAEKPAWLEPAGCLDTRGAVLQENPVMSQTQPERHEFQAEVKQLLDLMVHSLYSNKEIFLRELISNASDALDKRRFERLTAPASGAESGDAADPGELFIRLEADRAARTLSIADNGIGMTRAEVISNIGTIAKSGTKEFLSALQKEQGKATAKGKGKGKSKGKDKSDGDSHVPPELIGQFGVGFYSAFMVADKVTLTTRRAGEDAATAWESVGDGTYTITEGAREQPGTTITLHLKPVDEEQGLRDFTSDDVIRDIVKRYSDFVAYPVRMKLWRQKESGPSEAKTFEDATLNSMKAIWDRAKSEVTEAEYHDFYRHISHDWNPPLRTIPVKMEGTFEAYALLYIPAKAPLDLYSPEMKRGLQLYVKRVFVMDECRDLMPPHLRFVKGVVDAHDLSLNVSREILQKDRQIQVIRKQLVKKVLATLEDMKRDNAKEYAALWGELGPVLKEGFLAAETQDNDKLLDLVLAPSTVTIAAAPTNDTDAAPPTSLADYVGRMKAGQDAIYFLTGPSKEALAKSPLLETFVAKGYEVLLFSDAVDELWLERAPRYKDKPLQSIGKGEIKLGSEEDRKKETEALEEKQREYGDLLTCFRVLLADDIKEVRLSNRLTSSPVCLVTDEDDMTPRMQKLMEQLGQKSGKVKRILELNPSHPLVGKLHEVFAADNKDARLALYAKLLLGQAHLADSGQLPDPAAFSQVLADVMTRAL